MANELMADPQAQVGKTLRVHGYVEAGSIKEEIVGQLATRTFVLTREGKRVRVYSEGPKPDTFRDQSEVVATGVWSEENGDYVLRAHELSAKCPSKYQGAGANQNLSHPASIPMGPGASSGASSGAAEAAPGAPALY